MSYFFDETESELRLNFVVGEELSSSRLDSALRDKLEQISQEQDLPDWFISNTVTRGKIASWIEQGFVLVNSEVEKKKSRKLKPSDSILCNLVEDPEVNISPDSSIPLDVVFEDSHILVLNKQPGLVVHPGAGCKSGTLVNALVHYLGSIHNQVGQLSRPGLVHRLDKGTSGLMVVAKSDKAYHGLVSQFADRTVSRQYLALVLTRPLGDARIDLPIGRDEFNKTRMAVGGLKARAASTIWEIKQELSKGLLLSVKLETGRTHQIRVHLHARKAGIVGDPVYVTPETRYPKELLGDVRDFNRQALHAFKLELIHPISGEPQSFEVDVPKDMKKLIRAFNDGMD